MPLKQNSMWMFWSVLLTVGGIILLNISFTLEYPVMAGETGDGDLTLKQQAVEFTRKTVCGQNVQVIETLVEMWYIQNGEWPKSDLSDIGHDIDYFPKGVPVCPANGEPYLLDPVTHRIMGHDHAGVKSISEQQPDLQ